MILVILGEILLFTAVVALAGSGRPLDLPLAGTQRDAGWVTALLVVSFGIKAGALPLHVWLPLAHPAAPTPASAVLSGAMIKAGLLGWMRFLPLGHETLPRSGTALVVAGLLAMFYGAAAGVSQRDPKTVLAYSSISQMGYVTLAVGVGLLAPEAWPAMLGAVLVFTVHHGLAKSTLFLGVGAAAAATSRRAVVLALLIPALALTGAPLTSGAVAKLLLGASLDAAAAHMAQSLAALLGLVAVGTTLLMARFLYLVDRAHAPARAIGLHGWLAFAASLVAVLAAGFGLAGSSEAARGALAASRLAPAAWPTGLGIAIALAAWALLPPLERLPAWLRIPEGDLLDPTARVAARIGRFASRTAARSHPAALLREASAALHACRRHIEAGGARAERTVQRWSVFGIAYLAIVLVLIALLAAA